MILQELRRGSENAIINSIAFHPNGLWLICSSDTATIHIFSLKQIEHEKKCQYILFKDKLFTN